MNIRSSLSVGLASMVLVATAHADPDLIVRELSCKLVVTGHGNQQESHSQSVSVDHHSVPASMYFRIGDFHAEVRTQPLPGRVGATNLSYWMTEKMDQPTGNSVFGTFEVDVYSPTTVPVVNVQLEGRYGTDTSAELICQVIERQVPQ